jgi:hypothetical protein
VHADQADHVPPVHVRVCVPQLPHVCDAGPEQTHAPDTQVDPALHLAPHAPQLAGSVLVLTQARPQGVSPAPQVQAPHSHALLHVCEPVPSHDCVVAALHTPCPVQADHADQTPCWQVRVCAPQSPHVCEAAPVHVHAPAWHVAPAGHAWAHAPQLAGSVLVSTQAVPHAVAVHVVTHAADDAGAAEQSMPAPQAMVHDPQWVASVSACSQPSVGSPLQSPNPAVQDVDGNAQRPEEQVVGPLTLGSSVQSLSHEPQVRVSVAETQLPGAPQESWPLGQAQLPQWHEASHTCDPPTPQSSVEPAWQTPSPAHALHAPQRPSTQGRDWVPQRPHDWVAGPAHDVAMGSVEGGPGCGATTVTEDHGPQGGMLGSCVVHASLTTIVPPCVSAAAQADGASASCPLLAVHPVRVTQHAVGPHIPVPPGGN